MTSCLQADLCNHAVHVQQLQGVPGACRGTHSAANAARSCGCLRMTSFVNCFRTSSRPAGMTICGVHGGGGRCVGRQRSRRGATAAERSQRLARGAALPEHRSSKQQHALLTCSAQYMGSNSMILEGPEGRSAVSELEIGRLTSRCGAGIRMYRYRGQVVKILHSVVAGAGSGQQHERKRCAGRAGSAARCKCRCACRVACLAARAHDCTHWRYVRVLACTHNDFICPHAGVY